MIELAGEGGRGGWAGRPLAGVVGKRTRRLSLHVAALVGMVATVLSVSAPAADASPLTVPGGTERSPEAPFADTLNYAALGDSYSSGVGAPPYDLDVSCQRSSRGYPPLWSAEHHSTSFAFAACSRAKTADVLLAQVSVLRPSTDLVTITIGGNDAGFSAVLGTCTVATSDRTCDAAVDAAEAFERLVLPSRLTRTYAAIRRAAPRARVIVLGYPRLFDLASSCTDPHAPNLSRRTKLNQGADVLNDVIRQAISQQSGFSFADVRGRFIGHGVCSADPWINGPSVPTSLGPYHPNQAGYASGYAFLLGAATARGAAEA